MRQFQTTWVIILNLLKMQKTNIERWAELALFIIFIYLFAVKCTADRKIDLKNKPNYPYYIEK